MVSSKKANNVIAVDQKGARVTAVVIQKHASSWKVLCASMLS